MRKSRVASITRPTVAARSGRNSETEITSVTGKGDHSDQADDASRSNVMQTCADDATERLTFAAAPCSKGSSTAATQAKSDNAAHVMRERDFNAVAAVKIDEFVGSTSATAKR